MNYKIFFAIEREQKVLAQCRTFNFMYINYFQLKYTGCFLPDRQTLRGDKHKDKHKDKHNIEANIIK